MRVCEIVSLQTLLNQSNTQRAVISSQEFVVDVTVYVGLLTRDVLSSKREAVVEVSYISRES